MTTTAKHYGYFTTICYCPDCLYFVPPASGVYGHLWRERLISSRICPDCGGLLEFGVGRLIWKETQYRLLGIRWNRIGEAVGFELKGADA